MVASDRRKREDRGEDLVEIALVWRSGKQADWRQVLDSTFMTFQLLLLSPVLEWK